MKNLSKAMLCLLILITVIVFLFAVVISTDISDIKSEEVRQTQLLQKQNDKYEECEQRSVVTQGVKNNVQYTESRVWYVCGGTPNGSFSH